MVGAWGYLAWIQTQSINIQKKERSPFRPCACWSTKKFLPSSLLNDTNVSFSSFFCWAVHYACYLKCLAEKKDTAVWTNGSSFANKELLLALLICQSLQVSKKHSRVPMYSIRSYFHCFPSLRVVHQGWWFGTYMLNGSTTLINN